MVVVVQLSQTVLPTKLLVQCSQALMVILGCRSLPPRLNFHNHRHTHTHAKLEAQSRPYLELPLVFIPNAVICHHVTASVRCAVEMGIEPNEPN